MGVMLSAAGSLQWLHDRLAPETSFADLVAEAETWRPGAEGLLFAPYLAGERTPHADPDARAAFTGLELRHDRGALVRAVLEGVAFGLARLPRARPRAGRPRRPSRASGGGARGLWLRIVASVLGLPIELTAVEEGSAYGAALLGGVAGGRYGDVSDAVARCVSVTATVEPDPAWQDVYDDAYRALSRPVPRPREREGESPMTSLEGKVAVVTGASRGIGASVARMLADRGVRLGLASRSGDDLGLPAAVARPTDVRDRAQLTALVERDRRAPRRPRHRRRERRRRRLRAVRRSRPGPRRRDDRRQRPWRRQHGRGVRAAPHRTRRRRFRLGRLRGRPPRPAVRGGVLRLEVRPGRVHAGARPRAPPARDPLHERLPRRRRHRLRDGGGTGPHARHAGARRDDVRRRRGGGGAVRCSRGRAGTGSSRSRSGP